MVSQSQERRFVPFLLLVVEVLVMSLLEYLIAVLLVMHDQLLLKTSSPLFLIIEDLHDLLLVHKDVTEV